MNYNIAVVKGDGIGPEIVSEAMLVLDKVGEKFGHSFNFQEVLAGGCSIDKNGIPLTEETIEICKNADSVLLGAVGGYPVGARTVGQLRAAGLCGREEGECLLTCCNNAGPAFIFGVAGLGCFGSLRAGAALYAIHIGSAALVGLLHRRRGGSSAGAPPAAILMRPSQALLDSLPNAAGAMATVSTVYMAAIKPPCVKARSAFPFVCISEQPFHSFVFGQDGFELTAAILPPPVTIHDPRRPVNRRGSFLRESHINRRFHFFLFVVLNLFYTLC